MNQVVDGAQICYPPHVDSLAADIIFMKSAVVTPGIRFPIVRAPATVSLDDDLLFLV